MIDSQGRTIDYLRISVTDRCNLRCVYCMPEEGIAPMAHEEILTYEELERICACAAKLGIRRLKLTGGEPLVRLGIVDLVRRLKAVEGIEQVTMTTNGVLLGEAASSLAMAGLDGVNVSLDTLDQQKFAATTRRDELPRVLTGINSALEAGLRVKINCVPTRQADLNGLLKIAALAKEKPMQVRFIEMMPIGLGERFEGLPEEKLKACMEERFGKLVPCSDRLGNGPAVYYSVNGFAGHIGFISAVTEKFCGGCNRVRLTASGFLKLCLHYDRGIDLRAPLRSGMDDRELLQLLERAIAQKPAAHQFEQAEVAHRELHSMAQIGG